MLLIQFIHFSLSLFKPSTAPAGRFIIMSNPVHFDRRWLTWRDLRFLFVLVSQALAVILAIERPAKVVRLSLPNLRRPRLGA